MWTRQAEACATLLWAVSCAFAARPATAYLTLAENHLALGERDKALSAYEAGLQEHPKSPELAKGLGLLLFQQRPLDPRAGELFELAATLAPRDPETQYLSAQWSLINRRFDAAIVSAAAALAISRSNDLAAVQLHAIIALAEDQLNRPQRAEAAFRKSLAANRRLPAFDANTAFEYVRFLEKQAREEEAQKLNEEILQADPSFGLAHLSRAKALARRERMEEAAAAGEMALARAANNTALERAARSFLAKTYFALGKTEEAERHRRWIEEHSP